MCMHDTYRALYVANTPPYVAFPYYFVTLCHIHVHTCHMQTLLLLLYVVFSYYSVTLCHIHVHARHILTHLCHQYIPYVSFFKKDINDPGSGDDDEEDGDEEEDDDFEEEGDPQPPPKKAPKFAAARARIKTTATLRSPATSRTNPCATEPTSRR